MLNKAMERKIKDGQAVDICMAPRTENGFYILADFTDGLDYCDTQTGEWIRSIGQTKDGKIYASTKNIFFENDNYHCLFLK